MGGDRLKALKYVDITIKYPLIKRRVVMFTPKTILVPTDFSQSSERALEKAVDMAEKYNAKVILLHVIDENVQQCAVDYCLRSEDVAKLEDESTRISSQRLVDEATALKGSRHVEIDYDLKRGAPAEVILDEQLRTKTDLIVIGSHGKKGIMKHIIGSVTDKVVRSAKSPVMVVRE
jgi:nucleotide-binding universal stress UspA family protein